MKVLEYKAINKGSILGSMSMQMEEWGGLIIRDMLVMQKDGKRWISFPSRSYEKDGKKEYFHYVRFEDKGKHDQWQLKAFKSLEDYAKQERSGNPALKESEAHQGQLKGTQFVPPSENNLTPAPFGVSITGEELPF